MSSEAPTVRFLRQSNGLRLAYTTHGSGPYLVCPAWWVSHLEDDWQEPGFRELFGGFAEHFTVVRYDRPGAGLSDRSREVVDLDGEIATLAELVDHLEIETFDVFAVSCAGPPSLAYAAAHPHRVSRFVFFGSFLRGVDVGPPQIKDAIQGLVRAHWGMGSRTITNLFSPDLPEPDVKRVSRQHRQAASPEMAAQLVSLTFDVDVEPEAQGIAAPALVLHRKGDRTIRHEAGRELAASLPQATFRTLDGNAHVPWMGDVAAVRDAVLTFLGAQPNATAASTNDSANVLSKAADVWTVTFAGRSVHLKHARGLTDLAILLTNPGQEIHVGTLWSGADSAAAMGGGSDPILDDEALASYKARFRELEEAIADAEQVGNVQAAETHKEERDALANELRSAVGLRGKKRGLNEPSERARKAVSARLRASIKKIGAVHGELGAHLETAMSTGIFCSYTPEQDMGWVFNETG